MPQQTGEDLQKSAEQTKEAAQHTAAAAELTKSSADRTTQLAADRTVFAAERTYAAWVRTGLVSLASGVGAEKILRGVVPDWMVTGQGAVLVLFSAFCFVAGVWRQLLTRPSAPGPDVPGLHPFVLVVTNGFLTLVAIAALIGVLAGRTGQ